MVTLLIGLPCLNKGICFAHNSNSTQLIFLFLPQALRVSMEEQRQRQEDESRKSGPTSDQDTPVEGQVADSEEDMLQQALAMSADTPDQSAVSTISTPVTIDFNSMSEEEQIAYAMQLSMQGAPVGGLLGVSEADSASRKEKEREKEEEKEQAGAEGQVRVFVKNLSIYAYTLYLLSNSESFDLLNSKKATILLFIYYVQKWLFKNNFGNPRHLAMSRLRIRI